MSEFNNILLGDCREMMMNYALIDDDLGKPRFIYTPECARCPWK